MKVILLTDVKNVGKKDEVKEVADGYARNYLIKNKFAVEASKGALNVLSNQKKKAQEEYEEKKAEAEELKQKIEKLTLTFQAKGGAEGRMFGSISTSKVCDQLEKVYKIKVDKRKFVDNENITHFGVTNLKIELFKDVIATVKVHVKEA